VRYLEDFEIGEIRELGEHHVSKHEIIEFAEKWDPQPFHLDEAAAKASVFGGLTASSCHTYAISGLIHHHSQERIATVAMLGCQLRFPHPVRPGDRLSMRSECLDRRESQSRPQLGVVKTLTTLSNASGEAVMTMEASFMVTRRAFAETAAEDAGAPEQ
jgi:acyl dehydratase